MISNEFQDEPDISTVISESDRNSFKQWFSNERIETSISSMLLDLLLHNRLTDSEKKLLDLLTPADTVLFISDKSRYIYPDENDTLPAEFIETSLVQSSTALFTQNCSRTKNNRKKIHSARIGKDNSHDIILGFVHCDYEGKTISITSRFTELVTLFRECWGNASIAAASLKSTTDLPQLTVNQTSGRIIMANKVMATLLGKSPEELIDCEYCDISKKLSELPFGNRIRLNQKSFGSLSLAEFALTTGVSDSTTNIEKPELLKFLVHGIRNKLTSISSATEQLSDFSQIDKLDDELSDILKAAINQLGCLLDRLDLIYNYPNLQSINCSLKDSVEKGISQSKEVYHKREILLEDNLSNSEENLTFPEGSLSTLIDALLRGQYESQPDSLKTHISITYNQDFYFVKIVSNNVASDNSGINKSDWLNYAQTLADLMNLKVEIIDSDNAKAAIIVLHIPSIK